MQLTQESIEHMFAMSDKYRVAVQEFSHALGMDPELVGAGARFEYRDIGFFLGHHGQLGGDNMVVMVDAGEIPDDAAGAVAVYEFMMEHNALTPAALTGYFARAPGTKRALYCMPIALDKVDNGADEIAHVIASMADGLADLGKGLMKAANNYADAEQAASRSAS